MTTMMSSKGQIVLPKPIRDAKGWGTGMKLDTVMLPEGVLLRPKKLFPPTKMKDLIGMSGYRGRPATIADMNEAIVKEARRRGP